MATRRDPRLGAAALAFATLALLLTVWALALPPAAAADDFTQVEIVQLAQDCPTSASSSLRAYQPCDAVDGTTATRWAAISLRYPQRWQLDLGEPHRVVKSTTAWMRFTVSRKYFYKIFGSLDGETWTLLADRSKSSAYNLTNDRFDAVVRYVRVRIIRSTVGRAGIKEFRILGEPLPADTTATVPESEPAELPAPTPTGDANRLVLTAPDIAVVRERVSTPGSVESAAWAYFRDGKVAAAMAAAPNVDPGPTIAFSYTKLDTDSRHARNLAIAYAVTGDSRYAEKAAQFVVAWAKGNTPAPYSFTGDYQGGYHQSYGAFSFAYAYDLTRDSGAYDDAGHTAAKAWFRTWATVMKGYQDNWATDWVFTQAADG
ncbi:MAG: discoidin domain-containing protein, partial [Thermoleophilia bacterium]|nr:discoidin domain-containing protein [Thermoleophilia bacterium]